MTYDLGDCTQWEFMFPSNDKPILQLPDEDQFDDLGEEEEVSHHAPATTHNTTSIRTTTKLGVKCANPIGTFRSKSKAFVFDKAYPP